ncbi:hypothetical protein COT95_01215, partial [Candidatus Falkowbacteria bacterium CG10_big_fil_rev_8_21_14_0_10_37_6]
NGNDHDAEWLQPDGTWTPNVFEAAAFPEISQAIAVLTGAENPPKIPWLNRRHLQQKHIRALAPILA